MYTWLTCNFEVSGNISDKCTGEFFKKSAGVNIRNSFKMFPMVVFCFNTAIILNPED